MARRRYTRRWRNLIYGYAAAEATIGIIALIFPPNLCHRNGSRVRSPAPCAGTPGSGDGGKWILGTALILPQSVLLGMTFPLMTEG